MLNSVRWALFRRLSTLPRHALEISVHDLDLAGFELVFGSFGTGDTEEALVSDSDDEEEACVKKVVTLNSALQVLSFSFAC